MNTLRMLVCLLIGIHYGLLLDSASFAQRPISEQEQRDFGRRNRRMMEEMMRNKMQQNMPQQPPEQKKEEKPKPEESKKPEEEMKTVKRPTEGPPAVDPNRKKLQPDAEGRVQFNYYGQPWADVLQDYADAAGYSFDWQELPADYLNLTTRRKYTIKEAHDLLNRHLLARGFTMVLQGEVLTASPISKLDPSLVPKVEPDDLEDYSPSEFVRVRYELPLSMDTAKAAEDVKILLTPNGKVTPLLATRRLLVIDAVANQRGIRDLIYSEQLSASQEMKPREFQIRYRRAEYVADQIMIVLGMDPGARKSPMEMQMEQAQQQQQMQMMQQMREQGKDVSNMMPKEAPKVFIAVNRPRNTLLVNAPPELMPVVERTIKMLDVGEGEPSLGESDALTMEKYKTVTASADSVIKALKDIGDLDPLTQLQSDEKGKLIFAYATPGDHAKIVRMIGKLDGSGRRPEVIWLPPQLPADQVAGSIMALIVGDEKKKDDDDDMPWFFRRGGNNDDQDLTNEGFRVLPDVENNRLLLWASDDELAEVHNLIRKLSQNADGTFGDTRKVRRLRGGDAEQVQRLLDQLKSTWSGENELEIDIPPAQEKLEQKNPPEEKSEQGEDKLTRVGRSYFRLAQITAEGSSTAIESTDSPPPIKISVNADGDLVIACEDPQALDKLQEVLQQITPTEPEFHYFKLHHISAYDVVYNLEKYFEDEMGEEGEAILDWWGRRRETKPEPGPLTLGKRRPLRFIDDEMTNTVVVANASASQLKTIRELISMYDRPNKAEDYYPRKTVVVKVKYSRAADIAASLKDVYRDLLSSKDKEFQDKEGKQQSSTGISRGYVFGDIPAKAETGRAVVIGFAGVLSVGVDEVSNSLVICAREELVDSIVKTIEALDVAAKPDTVVQVHEVRGLLTSERLQAALSKAMGQPWPGGKPMQGMGQQQGQGGDNRTEANRENSAERRRGGGNRGQSSSGGNNGNNNDND